MASPPTSPTSSFYFQPPQQVIARGTAATVGTAVASAVDIDVSNEEASNDSIPRHEEDQQEPQEEEDLIADEQTEQLVNQFNTYQENTRQSCDVSFERLVTLLIELQQTKADIERTNAQLQEAKERQCIQRDHFLGRVNSFQ
jgi:hypothetical protein